MAEDSRITIMPDGSKFYSGSFVRGGVHRVDSFDEHTGISTPIAGGASGLYHILHPSQVQDYCSLRIGDFHTSKYSRADTTEEFGSYRRLPNSYGFGKNSTVYVKDIALKIFEGSLNLGDILLKDQERETYIRRIRRKHQGYRLYFLKCRWTDNERWRVRVDHGNNNKSLYALIPGKDNRIFWPNAYFLEIRLNIQIPSDVPYRASGVQMIDDYRTFEFDHYFYDIVLECLYNCTIVPRYSSSFNIVRPNYCPQNFPWNQYFESLENVQFTVTRCPDVKWQGYRGYPPR